MLAGQPAHLIENLWEQDGKAAGGEATQDWQRSSWHASSLDLLEGCHRHLMERQLLRFGAAFVWSDVPKRAAYPEDTCNGHHIRMHDRAWQQRLDTMTCERNVVPTLLL